MNNLYLTGIMGCGKSTAGKKAAKILKVLFFDVDHEVEKKESMTISEIFNRRGEDAFREVETRILSNLSAQNGVMISTGGGIILRQKNVDRMKESGKIVWIRRPIETILESVNDRDRPLIKNDPQKLLRIYADREPLYQKHADFIVDNNGSLDDAAEAVVKIFMEYV